MAVASNKPAAQPAARRAAAEPAAQVPEFSKEQELDAYRRMLLIRRFEEKAGQLYGMGLIGGPLILWLLYVSYLALRRSSEGGSTPILASALAIFAFLDVPFNYMANRFFRGSHPPPITLDDPRMKFALMSTMIAFLAFAGLIAWFRYELARVEQTINAAHIKKAALSSAALMVLPAMFLFQAPHRTNPRDYMYAAYILAWIIYVGYILLLTIKVGKLKKEAAELGL